MSGLTGRWVGSNLRWALGLLACAENCPLHVEEIAQNSGVVPHNLVVSPAYLHSPFLALLHAAASEAPVSETTCQHAPHDAQGPRPYGTCGPCGPCGPWNHCSMQTRPFPPPLSPLQPPATRPTCAPPACSTLAPRPPTAAGAAAGATSRCRRRRCWRTRTRGRRRYGARCSAGRATCPTYVSAAQGPVGLPGGPEDRSCA